MNKSYVPFIVTLFFSLPAFSENVTGLFKTETSDRGGYLIVEMGPCNKNNKLTCGVIKEALWEDNGSVICLLYTSPSPRDRTRSRMPSSA